MAPRRLSRNQNRTDYWPGFVDAMATLLLVIIFLLSVFMLTQFFLSQEILGKDKVLNRLSTRIAELSELLQLEQTNKNELEETLTSLKSNLNELQEERGSLLARIAVFEAHSKDNELSTALEAEKEISKEAQSQVSLLRQQISALNSQLAAVNEALAASEAKDKKSRTKIQDLDQRLNLALARRVQELSRYRSDFFGKLRAILKDRDDIRIVGDRFVFQAEVLYPVGEADLTVEGQKGLDVIAKALQEIGEQIPEDINWVLRVDGHTDNRPIQTEQFPSNWELSSARAISVARYLISKGIKPQRVIAAGFGEFWPLEKAETEDAYAANRRIELKLTRR